MDSPRAGSAIWKGGSAMVSTLPLMAASLLLGQTTEIPTGPAVQPSGKVPYVFNNGQYVPLNGGTTITPADAPPRRPILSRIQGWFGKRKDTSGAINTIETPPPPLIAPSPSPAMPPATGNGGVQAPSEFPRRMPATFKEPTSSKEARPLPISEPLSPAALQTLPTQALPTPVKTPILPANANRIGRDEKFEWVTGQIEMEKGQYVLYYATPETVDPHHGRLVLNPNKVDLRSFRSGDLISVRGHLSTGRSTPLYQLTSADLIEHAKR